MRFGLPLSRWPEATPGGHPLFHTRLSNRLLESAGLYPTATRERAASATVASGTVLLAGATSLPAARAVIWFDRY